jgi:tetratricopeptide (TPR) repeat protein
MQFLKSLCCIVFFSFHYANAQDPKSLFNEALKKVQENKLDEGIKLLDQCIAIKADDYPPYQIRGTAKSLQRKYEEALVDFDKALSINPQAKKAYLNRAIAKKKLTDYDGAIADLDKAIKLDGNMGEAYFNRALIYEMLGQADKACADYKAALKQNLPMAAVKVEMCENPIPNAPKTHALLRLAGTSTNPKYGLDKSNAVKVGVSANGVLENEIQFFELLRDGQNKPVAYRKTASCCPFLTPQGQANINTYEVAYKDASGKDKKLNVFITTGYFEEPKVIVGLKTVKPLN